MPVLGALGWVGGAAAGPLDAADHALRTEALAAGEGRGRDGGPCRGTRTGGAAQKTGSNQKGRAGVRASMSTCICLVCQVARG